MIPQITGGDIRQIETRAEPSFTYRLDGEQFVGNVDGLDAVRQAVFHILSTERYAYPIYDDNYGVELEQYKGQSFNFLQATIEKTLSDALLQDDRIANVSVISVTKTARDSALVEFMVTCNRGTFGAEVRVNI